MPHVADAMTMFNESWPKLLSSTALKYWSKSQCISMLQFDQAREQIGQSNTESEESTVTPVLGQELLEEISIDKYALNYRTQVENPLCEVTPPYTSINYASETSEALNSLSVTREHRNNHDIAEKELHRTFDNSRVSEVDNHPPNTNDGENEQKSGVSVSYICKKLSIFYENSSP